MTSSKPEENAVNTVTFLSQMRRVLTVRCIKKPKTLSMIFLSSDCKSEPAYRLVRYLSCLSANTFLLLLKDTYFYSRLSHYFY